MGFGTWLSTGEWHRRADEPTLPTANVDEALVIPRRDAVGRAVGSREALGLHAVYRAVEIRAVAAKQISIDALRGSEDVDPMPAILRRPDPFISRGQFVEQTVLSLNLNGNAYWRILRDDTDRVSSVWVMNPNDVVIDTNAKGFVTGYQYQGETLRTKDVKHLSRMRVPGSAYGLGPIQAAQAELRGAMDTSSYASDWLYSGDVPSGILKADQILTPEQAKQARTQWDETHGGRRGVAVLGQGLSYQQVFLSPKDAQFIESQQWDVTRVARLFGVPASLMLVVLDGSSQTYANVEQDWLGFIRFGLMNDLLEIEDALSDFLPRGQRARFNIEALLRADTKSRYEAHASAISAGWLTVNEVRAIEGYPALATITAPAEEPVQ